MARKIAAKQPPAVASLYWSPSLRGFFEPAEGTSPPPDAVPVDPARRDALIAEQAAGRVIVSGPDGAPATVTIAEFRSAR